MKKHIFILILAVIIAGCTGKDLEPRSVVLLDTDWHFFNEEVEGGELSETSTHGWEVVDVPHDWAISGEFDKHNDIQTAAVMEDGEWVPRERTGRTGSLPHIGISWYRKTLDIPSSYKNKRVHLEFDGAMSHAKVYLNGGYVGEWLYGYASFGFDVTDFVDFGKKNLLAVRLDNKPLSSRWHPRAGAIP